MGSPADRFRPALVARGVLSVVFCGFAVIALLNIGYRVDGVGSVLVCAGIVAVLLVLQIGYFARPLPAGASRYAALALQAALAYGPLVVLGEPWLGMPAFLSGSILLALPLRLALPGFAAVTASVAGAQALLTGTVLDVAYSTVSVIITGTTVWGLTRFALTIGELQDTRLEVARLEVARERLRIAQDLHDVLGSTLTAATLRLELVRSRLRTGAVDPHAVDAELGAIAQLSRKALTDVRSVSSGPLRVALDEEIRHARALLHAAGVTATIAADAAAVPVAADAALASVLRESVANVLRHGGGRRCEVTLRRVGGDVVLVVRNDQDDDRGDDAAAADGQGIANMQARVAPLGGAVEAGPDGDGTWAVQVTVPTEPPTSRSVGSITRAATP